MIPLLPCASIDELRDFWTALGCQVVWFQRRPNPYVGLRRGGMEIHYYELDGHLPEQSHSTCAVVVDDTGPVFEALATGLRALHGRLPVTGVPRITRPRARANNDGLSGFSLIDPGGNWVRFTRRPSSQVEQPTPGATSEAPLAESSKSLRAALSPLARALSDAVVQGDSHGDPAQARKILAGALRRSGAGADPVERVRALGYLAELCLRVEDAAAAREALDQLDHVVVDLDDASRVDVAETLAEAAELRSGM